MTDVKHFILDVNVIVDLWLRENSVHFTNALLEQGEAGICRFWIAASQIPTLIYVARRAFKRNGLEPEVAKKLVDELTRHLFERVNILSNHGFEQTAIYPLSNDFEDAQIAAAARSLGKQSVCIVTEDKTFDALAEITCMSPATALAWVNQTESESTTIPFIDLATQQASLRP